MSFHSCSLARYFVLFAIDIESRRVQIAGLTEQPNGAWMQQMARNLTDVADGVRADGCYVIRDRDPLFTTDFRAILKAVGVVPVQLPPKSPDLNAYAERFVRSVREECLDRIVALGERHLREVLREYLEHYGRERNHQGIEDRLIEQSGNSGHRTAGDGHRHPCDCDAGAIFHCIVARAAVYRVRRACAERASPASRTRDANEGNHMIERIGLALTLIVAAAITAPATAGYAYPYTWNEVSVSPGRWADGTMQATRDSSDTTAYLRCYVYSRTSGESGSCQARDAASDYVSCYTSVPYHLDTIRSIKPGSRVYFSVTNGSCSWIEVHHDSRRLP